MVNTSGSDDEQIPHLATFSTAAELGSFTKAAQALGLTQAAVSQRIHALEEALDKSLFHRRGGRVLLTEAGKTLHAYARQILDLHRKARLDVAGQEVPVAGELRLAASSVPGEHLLPALLSLFGREYPHVRVRATVSDSMAAIAQVERGEVSLGLVGRKSDGLHMEFRHLACDRMVLVVPEAHPWAGRKRVSLEQLSGQPIILRESGSGLRHCFEKSLERAGRSPADLRVALELGSNEAIKESVAGGLGISVISSHALHGNAKEHGVSVLNVAGFPVQSHWHVVHPKGKRLSPIALVFKAHLLASA